MQLFIQIFITTLLPAYFIFVLYVQKNTNNFVKYLSIAVYALLFAILFFVARWDSFYYPLRYIFPTLFLAVAILVALRPLTPEKSEKKSSKSSMYGLSAGVVLLAAGLVYTLMATVTPKDSFNIASPLRDGSYIVGHGGDATIINYHNYHKKQRYALDFVGYQAFNNPFKDKKDLASYSIYGAKIYSPCDGVVDEAFNDAEDLIPPKTDKENPSGNEVVLLCGDVAVQLSHMIRGSVLVEKGDEVKSGQELGKVGNSGNTSEPHLHIHATRNDVAVPLTIDGKFLIRNDIVH